MNACDRYEADPDDTFESPKPCARCGQVEHSDDAFRAAFLHIMTDGIGMDDDTARKKMANIGARLRGEPRPYPEVAPTDG